MSLQDILTALRQWLTEVEVSVRVQRDTPEGLWVFLETEHALAELVAAEPEMAPYRFVSFTVLDTRLDVDSTPLFCYYDDASSTAADILHQLNRGMKCIRAL